MTTIQDVLHDMALPQFEESPFISMELLPEDKIYPSDLLAILENNPRSVKLEIPAMPVCECTNCNDARAMYVYTWFRGPYRYPAAGKKLKWLEGAGLQTGWYEGEIHASPCPRCQTEEWKEVLRANCGLKEEKDLELSLSTFHTTGQYTGKEKALAAARNLIAAYENPSGFLTLWGEPGRGKSHLLKALVNGFRLVNIYSRYIEAKDMLEEIKNHYSDQNGGVMVEKVIQHYRSIRVLAIDEIQELQKATAWDLSTFKRIINDRYESSSLVTVLASQVNPECFIGDDLLYLASRIRGGVSVEVGGEDVRGIQGLKARKAMELS